MIFTLTVQHVFVIESYSMYRLDKIDKNKHICNLTSTENVKQTSVLIAGMLNEARNLS